MCAQGKLRKFLPRSTKFVTLSQSDAGLPVGVGKNTTDYKQSLLLGLDAQSLLCIPVIPAIKDDICSPHVFKDKRYHIIIQDVFCNFLRIRANPQRGKETVFWMHPILFCRGVPLWNKFKLKKHRVAGWLGRQGYAEKAVVLKIAFSDNKLWPV